MKKKGIPPVEDVPVSVPPEYIKDKQVDKDMEVYACLDGSVLVDGFRMRMPSLGVFSILESIDCKAIGDPENARLEDFARVLYVNHFRSDALLEFQQWISEMGGEYVRDALPEDTKKWHKLDHKVIDWAEHETFIGIRGKETIEEYTERISECFVELSKWFELAFTGFEMIPPGQGGGTHVFGAESMGAIIAGVGEKLNVGYAEILWDIPLTIIGHIIAQTAKANGAEGISRPKDKEDIVRQIKNAKEIVHSGQLLPWQIDQPEYHGLSPWQEKYFPHLQKKLDKIKGNK